MNLQQLESRRVQTLVELLHQAAEHVPTERASWKPDPNAKSAQEIVEHLIQANHFLAALIQGGSAGESESTPEIQSYKEALQALRESGKVLSEAMPA